MEDDARFYRLEPLPIPALPFQVILTPIIESHSLYPLAPRSDRPIDPFRDGQ